MQDHYADVIHRVAALAASLGMDVVVQPGILGRATVHATTEDAEALDDLVKENGLPMLHKWVPPLKRPNVEVQGQDEAQLRTVPLERPVGRKEE